MTCRSCWLAAEAAVMRHFKSRYFTVQSSLDMPLLARLDESVVPRLEKVSFAI